MRQYLFKNVQILLVVLEFNWGGDTKFVTLSQFYQLLMFPCFIISNANYYFTACESNSLLWPFPRCNGDPDCRNPRGFRIVDLKMCPQHCRTVSYCSLLAAVTAHFLQLLLPAAGHDSILKFPASITHQLKQSFAWL